MGRPNKDKRLNTCPMCGCSITSTRAISPELEVFFVIHKCPECWTPLQVVEHKIHFTVARNIGKNVRRTRRWEEQRMSKSGPDGPGWAEIAHFDNMLQFVNSETRKSFIRNRINYSIELDPDGSVIVFRRKAGFEKLLRSE